MSSPAVASRPSSKRQAAAHVISIVFDPMEPTHATGPDGFRCDRLAGEGLEDFEARAAREVLALGPPKIPPVLIFHPDRDNQTNSIATA
jgi:hypothetical protein